MAVIAQKRPTRFGLSPLAYGLALVVLFSLLRAGAAALLRQFFGSESLALTWPSALFWLGVFIVMSVGPVGGGLVWLGGATWRELGWRREGLLKAAGLGVLGAVGIFVLQLLSSHGLLALAGPPPGGIPTPEAVSLPGLLAQLVWGFVIASW
jgi:hypothetical protein